MSTVQANLWPWYYYIHIRSYKHKLEVAHAVDIIRKGLLDALIGILLKCDTLIVVSAVVER